MKSSGYDQKIVKKRAVWSHHGRRQPLFWIKNERKRIERTKWFPSVQSLFRSRGGRK